MNVKQVIVMRKDLNMRRGKQIAQGAHASMAALLKFFNKTRYETIEGGDWEPGQKSTRYVCEFGDNCVLGEWLNGSFTKICVYTNSQEEFDSIKEELSKTSIPHVVITDAGLTEFNNVPTETCIGIGPYISEEIDKITGNLPLL